ncbi:putative membrane protein [Nonlabens sp. Hel1_33_55]|uniref:PH domain-containing protein n=1 Tax=Nonlabens sp. Hel1_33_55 TaxID=1336802 RepID=UPI000875BFBF|nr:PH domain-containing protein [Nonlabens sp. Hel1_33_55]SCY11897.1 putative membrane protein [Nonlabens sp. Hel1_33_55]
MLDLSEPRRQSRKSILLYVFKNIKGLIAVALYSAFGINNFADYRIMIGIAAVAVILGLVSPILSYYYFTFHVEEDELIIQKGVLNKERKAIPLERIQSVNITQNLVQRILQLVAVEVDTAGSKAKELEIPGLSRSFAESFKNLLQDKREQNLVLDEENLEGSTGDNSIETPVERNAVKTSELLSLGIIDLFKIGITQNHLRSGGLALGVVFGFWYNIKDFVEKFYGDLFEGFEWENMVGYASLSLLVVAALSLILVSVIVSVVLVFNKYYGYKLRRSGDYLEIEMGLLNRREIKIPIQKIQILEFYSNPLRRMLNYQTAKIHQAQSQGISSTGAEVPACSPAMIALLRELIFDHTIEKSAQPSKSIAISHARLTFYATFLPLIFSIAASVYFEIYMLGVLAFLLFNWLIYTSYRDGQNTRIDSDEELVELRSGWLFHKTILIPIYKIQAVEKWRSVFLKRRQQVHFTIHTAAGSRGLRYFYKKEITDLKNRLHNLVLVSKRHWM